MKAIASLTNAIRWTVLDGLFDLLWGYKIRLDKLEQQHGITMTKAEHDFLQNMRGDRRLLVWYDRRIIPSSAVRKTKKVEKKKKKNRNEQSSYKTGSFEEVSDGVDYESCEKKMSTRILKKNHLYLKRKYNLLKTKHPKVRFLQEPQPSSMILLNELIRAESRNVVTNDIDYACAELDGNELSLYEIQMPKSKHSRW